MLVKLHLVLCYPKLHKRLVRRYEGPLCIENKVGHAVYKVEMPPEHKVHPIFHVSMLKPYHADPGDLSRNSSKRHPVGQKASYKWEVDQILAERVLKRKHHQSQHQYLV